MTEAEFVRGDRDAALDGLRGLAALMVVFFHCGVGLAYPPFFAPGFNGVHLFFVLSGYLIARPFLARALAEQPLPSWRLYAVRRFIRIYPTYLVALIAFIVMRVAGHLHAPSADDVVKHALLIFNWGTPEEFRSINIVMWTLAIEAQFYVILPLAVAICSRVARGRSGVILLLVTFVLVGVISRGFEYSSTPGADVRFRLPFSFLDMFAMGMVAAYLELAHLAFIRRHLALRVTMTLLAAVLFLGSNYWLVMRGGSDWLVAPTLALVCAYPVGVCVAFGLIVLAVRTRASYRVALLTSRGLTFVGQISYSIYLYHVGVGYFLLTRIPAGPRAWLGSHLTVYAIVQLVPVLAVSYLAYRAVELPSLRYIERFSKRSRKDKLAVPKHG